VKPPSWILLHEIIIRALQMVLNGWKKYVADEKKRHGWKDDSQE
jgi:hypothetical protein